jgi:hypothetical protein
MKPTKTKEGLLLVPGRLVILPAIKDKKTAEVKAAEMGAIAFHYEKYSQRLYYKVKGAK